MTLPTAEQLLNLADRTRHGLTPDETARLRAGVAHQCARAEQAEEERDEARMWARHGYEIGQRHCGWTDHGVAPAWLTDGWPRAFDSCEHLQQLTVFDLALTRVRAELARIAALPTVTADDGRANTFAVGASWAIRMVRENGLGEHQEQQT